VNFLYPLFLVAALAIAIPIIIHLFNFRKYKKVYFPDIRFLKEIQEQTQKSSQLKHLLILLSRILAVLSLVFAFAQPFFTKDADKVTQGPKAISIYIDNSYSMGVETNSLSLLDLAKGKAKQIIETSAINDQFQLLTNDFGYNENRFLSKNEALQQLSTIQLSPKSKLAATILEKQKQLLATEPGFKKQLIYISDFQQSSFPKDISTKDSLKKFFVAVNASATNNLSIDTVYFETPSLQLNEPNAMVVKIKNNGTEEVNTSVTLMVNNQLKSVINTTIKAGELKSEPLTFTTATAGVQKMQVFLNDYPVNFDDTFYVAGKVNSNFSVLILNQANANAFLSSVFKPGTQFRVDNNNIQTIKPELLKNYSLVVVNGATGITPQLSEALNQYVTSGGSMLVFPPQNGSLQDINALMNKTAGINYLRVDTAKAYITNYNKSHEIFRDIFVKTPENIDLPIVYKHYLISSAALSSQQKLFSFSNGDAFLSATKVGNGKLYFCTSSAEITWSNFPKSYWFLPILYKMAYSNAINSINALTLGKNATLNIENTKVTDKIVYHVGGNGYDAIPEQRTAGNNVQINVNNAVRQAGLYGVFLPDTKDTVFTGINYDRVESNLNYWSMADLKNSTKLRNAEWLNDKIDVAAGINELQHGMPLWKVCIILALLFLLTEILLIRFMK
jgi:hypothetical protein